jgi:hypothetical protein
MHLVGFITRIYHDARSSECQILLDRLKNTAWRWLRPHCRADVNVLGVAKTLGVTE